ncbi:MAG: thiamine biosynthesis protein ThiS [Candidatus Cloacimonetes bacterium HGW-Cloacimonetes-1]|jgi:thiamine biosynthesis protein ThiS|nr:MAG: thiamine biosynthesis protein ThiS [Candidatus Cloacimonetes bacterium HGW-Cloacimonetes-1]
MIKVNENNVEWEVGMTVRSLLIKMKYSFPMLVVKINGDLVKKADYDTTPIPDEASVMVIHLISGG